MKLSLIFAGAALLAAACSSSSGSGDAGPGDGGSDATTDAAQTDAGDGGSTTDTTPSDTGNTPDTSPPSDGGGDAGACNNLTQLGQTITVNQVAMDPPAPMGGTIADGTYTLTDVTIFTGPNGPTGSTGTTPALTAVIMANVAQEITADQNGTITRSSVIVTSGTSLTDTDTCPDTMVRQGSYTATPTSLVVLVPGGMDEAGARTVMETLTKM